MENCLCRAILGALVPRQRSPQVGRQGGDRGDQTIADGFGMMPVGQMDQHRIAGSAFDQGGDGGLVAFTHDQVAFRKTVEGPGEPGVA